jgi:hypothetical protein
VAVMIRLEPCPIQNVNQTYNGADMYSLVRKVAGLGLSRDAAVLTDILAVLFSSLSSCRNIIYAETDSGTHPASYTVDTGLFPRGGKAAGS